MAAFKKETAKNATFAEGGDNHMFGHQVAGEQKEAVTGHAVTNAAGEGASDDHGNASVGGAKFAEGGKGKMFGFQGSLSARAGITSAR